MATKIVSLLTAGTNNHQESAENVSKVRTQYFSTGVIGGVSLNAGSGGTGGFAVNAQAAPNNTLRVTQGEAVVAGTPTGGNSQNFSVNMNTFEDITIQANASGSGRFDFIYLSLDPVKLANPAVDASDVATLFVSRSTLSTIDNGTPPTFGYLLAVVTVANAFTTLGNAAITDSRVQSGVNAVLADNIRSTSGNHLQLTAGTSKLVKITLLRQDDTTNTYQVGNSVILTGWGVITPGVTSTAQETVSFGVTFLQRPIVILSPGGDSSTVTTYGAGGNTLQGLIAGKAHTITTAGFTAYMAANGNWAAGNAVFYQWTAIGEI